MNASVRGDIKEEVLSRLFRLPINVVLIPMMQLVGFPSEVVDAMVSVVCRPAFDLALRSNGHDALLVVCEEAHRYMSADKSAGFDPTRRAVARIEFIAINETALIQLDSTALAERYAIAGSVIDGGEIVETEEQCADQERMVLLTLHRPAHIAGERLMPSTLFDITAPKGGGAGTSSSRPHWLGFIAHVHPANGEQTQPVDQAIEGFPVGQVPGGSSSDGFVSIDVSFAKNAMLGV